MSSLNYETPSSTSSSELTTMEESVASCLMLLSKVGEWSPPPRPIEKLFDCKTCGKVFSTFQALGGHRASHKKPKLDQLAEQSPSIPAKPRSHKCSICGAEFALGQALGGHMRRHKDSTCTTVSNKQQSIGETTTVLMRSNSKRVCLELLDLDLSLNLTPPGKNDDMVVVESDLKLQLGKRDYELKKSTDLGRLQEYDLRMQMGKRRRFGDCFLGLVN